MAQRVRISGFLNYHAPHLVQTNSKAPSSPPAHQWGYVMGGDGRVADDAYLQARAKSSYPGSWESHYRDTRKWLGRRVFDCNAAAEAFYKHKTGVSIDTKARLNYANWCGQKSSSKPDSKLTGLPQLPGIAVFSGGSSATGITHVGFLYRKYGTGNHDWYVMEYRGRNYGGVITRLKDRPWRYWGKMDKYFEYDVDASWAPNTAQEGDEILIRKGDRGENVRAWQNALLAVGRTLPKYGADADFGSETEKATNEFLKSVGLPQTGIVDETAAAAMWKALRANVGDAAKVKELQAKIAAAQKALA